MMFIHNLVYFKELKECVKTDFRPFEERVISNSNVSDMDYGSMNMEKRMAKVQDVVENVFTPEDVEITEKLYCLWLTE